jgi:hypothetical protein
MRELIDKTANMAEESNDLGAFYNKQISKAKIW